MTEIAIRTQKLSRRFGNLTAVDGIDLEVAAGQFFGFLGPNGAGKSTTIKMLTGLLAPTGGSMDLLGLDFATHPVEVKRQIGVVPEGMGLLERLTGSEYLQFVGRMYGLDRRMTQQRANELLDFMQLADRPKTLIADYSHGMQKKLALAAAVIHGPRILFLDEPFEGVDALAAGVLKALLGRMTERGTTIFLTSHVLEIVERLCSHVAIIHKGRLVNRKSTRLNSSHSQISYAVFCWKNNCLQRWTRYVLFSNKAINFHTFADSSIVLLLNHIVLHRDSHLHRQLSPLPRIPLTARHSR